ncbi:MAG: hypothetical protein M3Z05_23440, partial [Gemmatimonadota bacterium]|nr:hypothetical protein [Gemmatimonadota bacterium]
MTIPSWPEPEAVRRIEPIAPTPNARIPLTRSPAETRSLLIELYGAAIGGAAPGPVTSAALQNFPAKPTQRIWLYA